LAARSLAESRRFRYLGRVARMRTTRALALAAAMAAAAGCTRGPKSPEDAYRQLAEAASARDGSKLFDALDLETRWSWMTAQRAQREAYDITLSNFPEGPERDRQLRRFQAGALAANPRELFSKSVPAETWSELAPLAGTPTPVFTGDGGTVTAPGPGGRTLVFRKLSHGHWGWGFAGLADAGEQLKRRALADLEMVRASAADYERAAARQAR
jgi:hypothetical protein